MSAIVAVVVVVIAFVSAPRSPAPLPITDHDPNYSLREPGDKILTAEDYGIRGESEEAELSSSLLSGVSHLPPPSITNGNASEPGAPSWFWKADK